MVRSAELRVASPVRRRGDLTNRQGCRLDVPDCNKRCRHTNTERDVRLRQLIGRVAVNERVLSIELDDAGPCGCVHLVQVASERIGHSTDRKARVYRGLERARSQDRRP